MREYTAENFYNFLISNEQPEIVTKNKKTYYINEPCSLDIETTSFYHNNEKRACMYVAGFCIFGEVFYFRKWEELADIIRILSQFFLLHSSKKLVCYVHNLPYEFQFMRGHFSLNDVFARFERKPISAVLNDVVELRCSYILSGLSLEKVAENLPKSYGLKKLVGNLDYEKIRHHETILSEKELQYLEYDCLIVYCFIKEEIYKNDDNIAKIPLTKTGYVRRFVRDNLKTNKTEWKKYSSYLFFNFPDYECYCLLSKAFMGGYTHANHIWVDKVVYNVHSIDFTSSYPARFVLNKFPMTKFRKIKVKSKKGFYNLLNKYCCVFEIAFENLRAKTPHHIISASKSQTVNAIFDNGRVVKADKIVTLCTEQDFFLYEKFYEWDKMYCYEVWYSQPDYLPKPIIESVLQLFAEKTQLKGVKGKEEEYQVSKGLLNGIYGMMVTQVVNNEIDYSEDDWKTIETDGQEKLDQEKNSWSKFLLYQWGVWITAYSRSALLNAVLEIGDDVIYCDTDSIKFRHNDNFDFEKYVENYNKKIRDEMLKNCKELNISINPIQTDIQGKSTCLGEWTIEEDYDKFKTLGAKRYAYEIDGKFNLTVSGIKKKPAVKYLLQQSQEQKKSVFSLFSTGMYIPADHTGKMTHSYIDEPYMCELTDYQGNTATVSEFCSIHLEKQDYSMTMSEEFLEFLISGYEVNFTTYTAGRKHKDISYKPMDNFRSRKNEKNK